MILGRSRLFLFSAAVLLGVLLAAVLWLTIGSSSIETAVETNDEVVETNGEVVETNDEVVVPPVLIPSSFALTDAGLINWDAPESFVIDHDRGDHPLAAAKDVLGIAEIEQSNSISPIAINDFITAIGFVDVDSGKTLPIPEVSRTEDVATFRLPFLDNNISLFHARGELTGNQLGAFSKSYAPENRSNWSVFAFPPWVGWTFTVEEWKSFLDINNLELPNHYSIPIVINSVFAEYIPLKWGEREFTIDSRNYTGVQLEQVIPKRVFLGSAELELLAPISNIDSGGQVVQLQMPSLASENEHKILRSGVSITLKNITMMKFWDGKELQQWIPGQGDPKLITQTTRSTIGVQINDETWHSISFGDFDYFVVSDGNEDSEVVVDVFNYAASSRHTFGQERTPTKLQLQQIEDQKFEMAVLRRLRNLAVTNYLPRDIISIGIGQTNMLSYIAMGPSGGNSVISIVDHADYQNSITENLALYGSSEGISNIVGGLVKYKIPHTKTVFAVGTDTDYQISINGNLINHKQNTILGSQSFKKIIDQAYQSGLAEIAFHNFGTAPDANEQASIQQAFDVLKTSYDTKIWTDHGGFPNNILFYGWDDTAGDFYIYDRLEQAGIELAWAGPDFSLYRESKNFSAFGTSALFYELPYLSRQSERPISFFRSTIMKLVWPGPAKNLGERINEYKFPLIWHSYLGSLLNYDGQDSYTGATYMGEMNELLMELDRLRASGELDIVKVSELATYWKLRSELHCFIEEKIWCAGAVANAEQQPATVHGTSIDLISGNIANFEVNFSEQTNLWLGRQSAASTPAEN